jgi:hypothetical protein
MPTDITVTELKETVTVTGGTTSITVTGDSATVSVATTSQPVSVVEENATFTISTISNKTDVGLGNVDNTSDANKPVSTATQTALDTKLNKSGGTMTGALTLSADPAANLQAATKQYVDSQVTAVPVITSTDDVPEGSVNLYFTTSAFDTRLATKSTTNVAEGSNLYHTTARARSSISGTGSITYNNTTGVISYTGGANPVTTDELPEGTTNKYYTDTRVNSAFDTRLATKTTSNLNEGTNLYYTSARANTDFDTRLATKATTNLAEGTNLYYTSARANTDFDGRLATKSTTNLAEGTNLYHTTARARAAVSGSTGITYTEGTGAIAVDSTIATKTYADSAAASAAAAIVDASPATLDTLNELAAALGDDPNFATTMSTALGNKLNTADFGTTFTGQLAGKSTTDVAEGTNLYYTDARARASISATGSLSYNSTTGVMSYTQPSYATVASTGAYSDLTGQPTLFSGVYADLTSKPTLFDGAYSSLSGLPTLFSGAYADLTGKPTAVSSFTNDANYITTSGARSALSASTGVTYDSGTGVISIGQSIATTASPTFNSVTATGNFVKGTIRNSTQASAGDIFALNSSAAQAAANPYFRGVSLSNSENTTRGPATVMRSYTGNATAGAPGSGSASRGRVIFEKARGFPEGVSTGPSAVQSGDILGSVDVTGYTSTGWLNDTTAAVTGFFGFTAAENYVSNTNLGTTFTLSLAPTNIPITSGANLIQVFSLNPQAATYRSDEHTFSQGKTGTTQYLNMSASRASFSVPIKYPLYTTTQRDALGASAGWVIFNTTTAKLECHDGTTWNALF